MHEIRMLLASDGATGTPDTTLPYKHHHACYCEVGRCAFLLLSFGFHTPEHHGLTCPLSLGPKKGGKKGFPKSKPPASCEAVRCRCDSGYQ